MNDLSNGVVTEKHGRHGLDPIPSRAIFALVPLFLVGLSVSIFILVVVRNASFFVAFALLSSLVISFILWNTRCFATKASLVRFVSSLPETDLAQAKHGQLVKITGYASCGTVSLESSYERANRCIYTSTLVYEHTGSDLKPWPCFQWSLAYCERFCTEFYISDEKSGNGATVKAGHGCTVVPLVFENELVNTSAQCTNLSPSLRKWLRERNLSDRPRLLRLLEGYVREGSTVSVVGMVRKDNGTMEIVQPPEVFSTGCMWKRLLLPVDVNGLVICVSQTSGHSEYVQQTP